MTHYNDTKKGEDMGVFFNDDVLRLALERIRAEEPEETTEFNIGKDDDTTVVVSRNSDELISLKELHHNGVTYYLGLPK